MPFLGIPTSKKDLDNAGWLKPAGSVVHGVSQIDDMFMDSAAGFGFSQSGGSRMAPGPAQDAVWNSFQSSADANKIMPKTGGSSTSGSQATQSAPVSTNDGSGGGGGGGNVPTGGSDAPKYKDTSAARGVTQNSLDNLPTWLQSKYTNIDNEYSDLIDDYDIDRGRVSEDYQKETGQNMDNLLRNRQNALLAAAQGRRGLRGTLSALGALSGDGSFLADQAVTTAANQDLGGAQDTYQTNSTNLEDAWERYDEDDQKRRKSAEAAKKSQREAAEIEQLEQKVSLLEKLASLFDDAGMFGEAGNTLNQINPITGRLAGMGRGTPTAFSAGKADYNPAAMESYRAGAGDMTVDVMGGDNGGARQTIIAGRGNDRRRREEDEI